YFRAFLGEKQRRSKVFFHPSPKFGCCGHYGLFSPIDLTQWKTSQILFSL
ncbi:LOW QUALITY PROTEIN: hypothetical protein PanWU01x14_361700, partial [Parasponia andersonii]